MFILNESEYTTTKGSKYTGDLQGAMYAVLDNTKNWNRICEAASLMELQYYNEHGANVWAMDEAAMPGFITAILNFLKKVKDKIVEMFKHFFGLISSLVSKDKDFVKKYQKDIMAKASRLSSTNSIEIDGYTFKDLDKGETIFNKGFDTIDTNLAPNITKQVQDGKMDSDYMSDLKEEARGTILSEGKMDSDEFKTKIKEKLYGSEDKDSIEITSSSDITKLLSIIKDTSTNTKNAEKAKNDLTKLIDKEIKKLQDLAKGFDKSAIDSKGSEPENTVNTNAASVVRYRAELLQSMSNDYTTAYGILLDAYKDRNRQARAVCVKCLGLKQESASYYGSGSLLGNVTIL